MHWLIELFGALVPVPENATLHGFCRDHPLVAILLAAFGIGIMTHLIAEAYSTLHHQISQVIHKKNARAAIIVLTGAWIILSVAVVVTINRLLEPVPVFATKQTTFIREPVVLSWSYVGDQISASSVTFDVELSKSADFAASKHFVTNGTSWYSYAGEGESWWRVRALSNGVSSRPSRAIRTSSFKSAYDRVRVAHKLTVYVSNEISLGIFKGLDKDGNMTGVDIELIKAIAKQISSEENQNIEPVFIPVPWSDLLSKPSDGSADMIISAITKTDSRENEFQLKFSRPYFCTGESLLFKTGASPEASAPPLTVLLNGKGIGYPKGTTSEKLVEDIVDAEKGNIKFYKKSLSEAEDIVQRILAPNANVQFGVADTAFAVDRVTRENKAGLEYKIIRRKDLPSSIPKEDFRNDYAIGVAAGETKLVEITNKVIDKLDRTKEMSYIMEKATSERFPDIEFDKRSLVYKSDCE